MVVSLWLWSTTKLKASKIHVKCWQFWFWWPCGYGGAIWSALPNRAHPWLHAKPLDAAIGRVPAPNSPGGCHGRRFWMKHKNTNKTQFLPSFLTVDQRKKSYTISGSETDPLLTLLMQQAAYKCETPLFERKSSATFLAIKRSQRTQIRKVLNLERSPKNLWAKYGPIAVKLLIGSYLLLLPARVMQYLHVQTFHLSRSVPAQGRLPILLV